MLGMDGGVMLMASSDVSRRRGAASDGVVAHQFPAGLRVLVVDDDPTCLKILERMLRNCLYEVTTCSRAIMALAMLRERKVVFDLVLSDVHMPDMDGFKLLEHIGLEMDLPVIMMSVDDKKDVVMKGVTHGACDYLIKPIRIEAIKTIWQHVVRKRRNDIKDLEQSGSIEDCERNRKVSDDADYASSANEGSWKSSKRRKEEEDELDERDDSSTLKKPRVVWSVELHQQFVAAVNQLGIDKAVPKKILELMNVPGLTRENVASHLQVFDTFSSSIDDPDSSLIPSLISTVQKYRLYLRRLSGVSQGGLNTLMGPQDASFGHMSSLDLQALAASSPHSLASLQAGGLVARTTAKTSGIGMPYVDQRNPYTSEASTIRFGAGQQLNGSSTQAHVFHGLPTNMEPKQLPHLHQPIHLPGNMGLQINEAASGFMSMPTVSAGTSSNHLDTVQRSQIMQMTQARSRGQSSNEISGVHHSGAPLSTGQQIIPREIAGQVLGRNVNVMNGRDTAYDPGPQASLAFDFQMNNSAELPGNGFPLITAGASSLRPTGMFQNGRSFEVKGSRGFVPSYDFFNELQQGKTQDWELQNLDSAYEASRRAKPGFAPAVSNHQGFQSGLKSGQNENSSVVSNPMASLGENQFGNSDSFQQRYNNLSVDSLSRIKTESMSDFGSENMYTKHYGQDDLMSVFLKQQQGTVGSVDNESNFDGYSVDDIHV